RLSGVVAPDSASRLKLAAGIVARRMRHAVLDFASVGRRCKIDKKVSSGVDCERMHGVVAGERKAGDDHLGLLTRNDFAILQRIADDAIVDLGVERALIERDSGSAVSAFGKRLAEPLHHVGVSSTLRILQSDKKSTRRRLVVPV